MCPLSFCGPDNSNHPLQCLRDRLPASETMGHSPFPLRVLFYLLVSRPEGLFLRVEPMLFSSMVNQGLMGLRAHVLQGLSGLTCTCSVIGASPTKALKPIEEQRHGRDGWNLPHKN